MQIHLLTFGSVCLGIVVQFAPEFSYKSSKDIYLAFNRLVEEQEAPAIIIADLLRNNSARNNAAN